MMIFEKIKELREKCKITQQQIANELGINVATYRKIEKGQRNLTYEQALIFAKLLQIDNKELLDLLENDQNTLKSSQTQNNETSKEKRAFESKGVLIGDDIEKLFLIDKKTFNNKCLQIASYDLRLGDEYYVPSRQRQEHCSETQNIVLSCPFHKKDIPNDIQKCSSENGVLRISPFSTIVFSTEEILEIPDNVIGRFDLRIRFAMQGLVLQVGTQIEPCYKGRLFGLLLNFSDKEICIPQGTRLLTAEFSYTTSKVKNAEDKEYNSLKEFIERFPPTKGTLESFFERIKDIYGENQKIQNEIILEKASTTKYIDGKVHELDEKIRVEMTEKRVEKSEKYQNRITLILAASALIIAILIPIVVMYMSKKVIDKDDYPFERIIHVETENKILKNEKDSLKLRVSELNNKSDSLKQEMFDLREQFQKINMNKKNPQGK